MNNNFNAESFFKFKALFDTAMDGAASGAAGRSGITQRQARLLSDLFYRGEGVPAEALERRGFSSEAEKLVSLKMAQIDRDGLLTLTGRGKIAGKSVCSAQEKFLEELLKKISPEEAFIISGAAEKISSLLREEAQNINKNHG